MRFITRSPRASHEAIGIKRFNLQIVVKRSTYNNSKGAHGNFDATGFNKDEVPPCLPPSTLFTSATTLPEKTTNAANTLSSPLELLAEEQERLSGNRIMCPAVSNGKSTKAGEGK